MSQLLGIKIKNYRALGQLSIGQVVYARKPADPPPLPRFACFIGPNGSGKSTLLDAFGFIADCLLEGVEAACDKPQRGGFERVRTQGATGPISFELFFEDADAARPIVYELDIDLVDGVPRVTREWLRQRRKSETAGKPYYFLKLARGKGKVWAGNEASGGPDDPKAKTIKLPDLNRLAITALGNIADHPRIVRLREYIEQWYLSYFVPDQARMLPVAGAQPRLDRTGSNVGNVLQYLQRSKKLAGIVDRLAESVPGLKSVAPEPTADGRLLLEFAEDGYRDPFYQQNMSDGTLKMLAYAVLLNDPSPRPFIGIEEPENGLYVELIERLASQFVKHTTNAKAPTQIFVTTHSSYFVDALTPEQVWIMEKVNGRAVARRVADLPLVLQLTKQGIPLGAQWYANHFGRTASGAKAKSRRS